MEFADPNAHSSSAPTPRRRRTEQGAANPIEATVTKLLVATKQLLESLTLWSQHKMNEDQVSDIFVQLATQFNLACQSFHDVGIETRELAHIPDDLRACLETALGEEPSPTSLDQYLPKIKEIIINLLQGLRQKQNDFREQNEAKTTRLQNVGSSSPTPTASRSKSNGSNFRQPAIPVYSPEPDSNNIMGASGAYRSQSFNAGPPAPTVSISTPQDDMGHAQTLASLRKSDAITRRASYRRHSQRFSTLIEQNTPPAVPRRQGVMDPSLLVKFPRYTSSQGSSPMSSPNSLSHGQFSPMLNSASSLSTGSMSNRSMEGLPQAPTAPVPHLPQSPVALPPLPYSQPIQSTSSMAGATVMGSPQLGTSYMMQAASALATPEPMAATLAGMTPQQLPAMITTGSNDTMNSLAPAPSSQIGASSSSIPASDMTSGSTDTSLTLFLQVGKSVKKTRFEGELTHSGLRMVFMEKFQYNPGQEDFPTIYVKDPQTNIHYELESLADVKQNAFLSLNVDDLENIQRKMDQGFAALTKELGELKKAQEAAESNRQKAAAAAAAVAVANSPPERKVSSMEGTQALRSLVGKVMAQSRASSFTEAAGATSASVTGTAESEASPTSPLGTIAAADLKPQYEEVLSLRRDLGVVRQLYTEMQAETKTMLGSLAGYTSQIRKKTSEGPVSSRTFIESGKVKLDQKSEGLTNRIEDLQDVVEDMKMNVTQRRGRPSDHSIAFADKQCEDLGKEIEELSNFIQTLRPSWKKTWEVELQTIVKEQMFLKEQEGLLEDLKEDRASLLQTLANLKKLLELQVKNSSGGGGSRDVVFLPIVADEGDLEGLKSSVLEEVKMIAPDSDKRLRAMAQMEKLRHIELSNRIDEFEEELTTFVGASKLRKTGGALEVERQRQQRDSEHLKSMFASKIKAAETAAASSTESTNGDNNDGSGATNE